MTDHRLKNDETTENIKGDHPKLFDFNRTQSKISAATTELKMKEEDNSSMRNIQAPGKLKGILLLFDYYLLMKLYYIFL